MIVTLLITRAVTAWPRELSPEDTVNLFFLHEGTAHLEPPPPPGRIGQRVHCLHSRQEHNLPPWEGDPQAGGLASLGAMVRESAVTISCPRGHWPQRTSSPGLKEIAILMPETASHPRTTESLRLATGLIACRHAITLYHGTGHATFPPAAAPYVEALHAFHAQWRPWSPDPLDHEVILEL